MSDIRPGSKFAIYVNQAYRDATVLAIRGKYILAEYEMGNGTTALRLLKRSERILRQLASKVCAPLPEEYKPLSYHDVSRPWLRAIISGGMIWRGCPQQNNGAMVPTPGEMLAALDEHFYQRRKAREAAHVQPG